MQRNPKAQAAASRRAIAKSKKIKELGIKPDMTVEEQDVLVEKLALAKSVVDKSDPKDETKGPFFSGNDFGHVVRIRYRLDNEIFIKLF